MSLALIQKAVYTALTGDATLMAAVTGVYDHPDPDAVLPIVSIGDFSADYAGTKTEDMVEYTAELNVWAADLNFATVKIIQDYVRDVLHRQALSVDSGTVTYVFEEFATVQAENDGEARGVQRFRMLYNYP